MMADIKIKEEKRMLNSTSKLLSPCGYEPTRSMLILCRKTYSSTRILIYMNKDIAVTSVPK